MEGCRLDRTLLSNIVKYEHRTVFSNAACFCCPAMPRFEWSAVLFESGVGDRVRRDPCPVVANTCGNEDMSIQKVGLIVYQQSLLYLRERFRMIYRSTTLQLLYLPDSRHAHPLPAYAPIHKAH